MSTHIYLATSLAEWFLRYLKSGEPVGRNRWPSLVKGTLESGFGCRALTTGVEVGLKRLGALPLSALDDATAARSFADSGLLNVMNIQDG